MNSNKELCLRAELLLNALMIGGLNPSNAVGDVWIDAVKMAIILTQMEKLRAAINVTIGESYESAEMQKL